MTSAWPQASVLFSLTYSELLHLSSHLSFHTNINAEYPFCICIQHLIIASLLITGLPLNTVGWPSCNCAILWVSHFLCSKSIFAWQDCFYASAVIQLDCLWPRKIQVKLQALRSSHMPAQLGWEQATRRSLCTFVHLSTRKPPAESLTAPWSVMAYEITCHLKIIISYIYVLYLNSPVCNLLLHTGRNSLKAKCSGLGTDVGFFWAALGW